MDSAQAETSGAAARRRIKPQRPQPGDTSYFPEYTTHHASIETDSRSIVFDNGITCVTPEEKQYGVRWTHFDPQADQPGTGHSSPGSPWASAYTKVYRGSFAATPISRGSRSRLASGQTTPRGDTSLAGANFPLEQFMSRLQLEVDDLEDYGVEELRDGFFDASFYKMPRKQLATAKKKKISRALHKAFVAAIRGLDLPRPSTARRHNDMSKETVEISVAVRDFRSEVTISKISPEDMISLRNGIQAVIREFLRLECIAPVFEPPEEKKEGESKGQAIPEIKIPIENKDDENKDDSEDDDHRMEIERVRAVLAGPSREMVDIMKEALEACDSLLMHILHQTVFIPPERHQAKWDCADLLQRLCQARNILEEAHNVWVHVRPSDCGYTIIQIFLFTSTLLQASDQVINLVNTTGEVLKKRGNARWRIWLPNYPIQKMVYRSNLAVRHDRGGTTTAFYFRTMKDIALLMSKIAGKAWVPDADFTSKPAPQKTGKEKPLRFRVWEVLHELQGFEARYALKTTMTACLLGIPAWMSRSQGWWSEWGGWWCIVAAWHLMQPRVGGNLNDLAGRIISVVLGALWGALSYAAGNGNPYVMAIFALIYSIPFLYRFMLSSHPRSGLIGCLSFTVVSMTCYNDKGSPSVTLIAYTRGTSFIVGVLASVFINWCLWPFVARHELRKSLANMLINLSIVYRSVVAKYIYHDLDYMPSEQDIIDSQIREAKLREGFVRIRELLKMTEHEPRLRERFDPTPYEHLVDSSENFFDRIIDVRQASLYFRISGDKYMAQMMLSSRRDAVAAILMNLWVLGGGLRSKTPIPKYLPSAAIARKRLLQRIEDLDMEGYYEGSKYEGKKRRLRFTELERLGPPVVDGGFDGSSAERDAKVRYQKIEKWAHFYQYAYSSILNEIVRDLEQLQIYTKAITGEMSIGKFD
ncbi:hypothetical protein AA313_de0210175 [Arthrobotrys entomopaga]|nr:hypothetical protein AA313_de0210175 [Arthrobotrys entomopaga]